MTLSPRMFDARLPPEIARLAEDGGVAHTQIDTVTLAVLAVLGGAYVALGANFSTVALSGAPDLVPYGWMRVVGGLVFSLGLILVILGGAQLFTGDVLMVMAWASKRLRLAQIVRVWAIVFAGNFVGAVGTALLVFLGGHYFAGNGAVGLTALATANAKAALPFGQAFVLGILCNTLVCLAIWLTLSTRTAAGKLFVLALPIAAFAAAGFEHVVANMYFIPMGFMIHAWAPDAFWQAIKRSPEMFAALTATGFGRNLVAVTLGNIVGGAVFVGAVYWFLHCRPGRR